MFPRLNTSTYIELARRNALQNSLGLRGVIFPATIQSDGAHGRLPIPKSTTAGVGMEEEARREKFSPADHDPANGTSASSQDPSRSRFTDGFWRASFSSPLRPA